MAFYIITGKADCPNYAHALYVAEFLSNHLPNFRYRPILKDEEDWKMWLDKLNTENEWHQTKSPVIWKEVNRRGGKIHLIGGLSEFWEYCFDYYGFQSTISKQDLGKIMEDNQFMASKQKDQDDQLIVSIIGALNPMLEIVILELQDCFLHKYQNGVFVRLFDFDLDNPEGSEFLLETIEEIGPALKSQPDSITVVTTLPDALKNCDLILVIQDYSRNPKESTDQWFHRCMTEMLLLAEEINTYAKRQLRVVLCHTGPVCFNASILVENCTTIRLANIVAVTADEGISFINIAAEICEELVENFCCPPVWGFCGLLSFIDIANTVVKSEVYKPFKRTLTAKENSKLAKGTIHYELRFFSHLTRKVTEIYEKYHYRSQKEKSLLQRHPVLVKIRALVSLLKLWFADNITDDIISLGVCSNGSFGFPSGIVFSQPVILNEKRIWEPLSHFPVSSMTKIKITEIILEVKDLLKKLGFR